MPPRAKHVSVVASPAGYIGQVVRALKSVGWTLAGVPANGRLARNGQLIVLQTPEQEVALRVLVYKITTSGRGRGGERRVEITSTYAGRLTPAAGYNDVVLGYDIHEEVFVGLDPTRLHHGGPTSNASSFLEASGLRRSDQVPFILLSRPTNIFPEGEYQAFFRPERIGEYLLNYMAIHAGAYPTVGLEPTTVLKRGWDQEAIGQVQKIRADGNVLVMTRGAEASRRARRFSADVKREMRRGLSVRRPRSLSPEELKAIQQRQEQNGILGEQYVLEQEKAGLITAGRPDLADQVDWVSQRSVGEGYDILSFDPNSDDERYIEVKATENAGATFDMSVNEWNTAARLKDRYHVYRVTNVRNNPTIDVVLQNPLQLERKRVLERISGGWRIKILESL